MLVTVHAIKIGAVLSLQHSYGMYVFNSSYN